MRHRDSNYASNVDSSDFRQVGAETTHTNTYTQRKRKKVVSVEAHKVTLSKTLGLPIGIFHLLE